MSLAANEDALRVHLRWQQARITELSAPDSWLGLRGLFWLMPGDNPVGLNADGELEIPAPGDALGVLHVDGLSVEWRPEDGPAQPMVTDCEGVPSTVNLKNRVIFIAERDGRLAARVRDPGWAARQPFSGLQCFPFDPAWVIDAEWSPIDPPQMMELPNVLGELRPVSVAFCARFVHQGEIVTLLPVSVDEDGAFFVFRDRTSGRETYGAGRFIKAGRPANGRIALDFNRAYNPPCAFTAFATCPLPPPENWLGFAVPAGEMKWAKPEH